MVVKAAGDDPIHLAYHVIEVADRITAVHPGELLGLQRIDLPAVRDPHAGEGRLLLSRARIHQRRPELMEVRVAGDVEAADAERGCWRPARLPRSLSGVGDREG